MGAQRVIRELWVEQYEKYRYLGISDRKKVWLDNDGKAEAEIN